MTGLSEPVPADSFMNLTSKRAQELMNRFPDLTLLVVGDLMLDRYVRGRVDRISPEAPVPVVRVESEHSVPGGACNVGLNIQALGGRSNVCGLTGDCPRADELAAQLEAAGVDTTAVLREERTSTIVKTRIVSDRQQMLRVDRENANMSDFVETPAFLEKLDGGIKGVHGVVMEDYGKGVLRQCVVDRVRAGCRAAGIPSGYDPKDNHELDVRGVTFATPNRKEAFTVSGARDRDDSREPLEDPDLLSAADRLMRAWEPEHLMITLGPQGMLLKSGDGAATHVSTRAREVFDVSGAGDTVIAATMLALAAGASFREAAELANVAAGIVVGKLGTATTSPEEILDAMEDGA